MDIPELHQDETVILQAQNVKVKSVVFDAVLTNNRLILIDSKKELRPPQTIPIATISSVESGENAISDPILTFSLFSKGGTARQMILTFPREAGGERWRERDDWIKALREHLSLPENAPAIDQGSSQKSDSAPQSYPGIAGSFTQKKKIEITQLEKNSIETVPAMPQPVDTTSLPIGSFCSRCGYRIPPESTFCNGCGTPVVIPPEKPAVLTTIISTTPVAAPAVVPQVRIPTFPVFGLGGDRKEPTLNEVIHSIEPLIEDSVPRSSEAAPLVPRHYPAPLPRVETPEPPATSATVPQTETPAQPHTGEPVSTGASSSALPDLTYPTRPVHPFHTKKPKFIAIAIIAIVILAIIGGIVIFSNFWGTAPNSGITPTPAPLPVTGSPTPAPVPVTEIPTPDVTREVIVTPAPQPQVILPPKGVWVRITYPGKYTGTYGTPGSQSPVNDTGDHFYMVSTMNGPVEAFIRKMDGSADELVIEAYKNGELMKRTTSDLPRGTIEFQADFKPKPAPTLIPVQIVNATGIA